MTIPLTPGDTYEITMPNGEKVQMRYVRRFTAPHVFMMRDKQGEFLLGLTDEEAANVKWVKA